MRLDIHQHFWSEPLVAALARRRHPPRVRRDAGGLWLDLAGEPPCRLGVDDLDHRARLVRADGLDRALIGLSSPLGIECLPPDEAEPILDAYHGAVLEAPSLFGGWASVGLRDLASAPAALSERLDDGFHGLCLPSGAIATPRAVERLGPLLDVLERRDAPVFVHPGPSPMATDAVPSWWPALTDYGPRMIDAMVGVVGVDRLVHGSDRPVVEPPNARALGPATWEALTSVNPGRLLAAAA